MRRREFIAGLGVAAWPLAVRAQQANLPIIGFLGSDPQKSDDHRLRAFAQGLAEIGYVEGQNVAIEYRWAGTDYDRFATLAADLVHRGVSVIFAGTTPAVLAAMATTKVTPIVFGTAIDPISGGLVSGLDRPGGNLTGIYSFSEGLTAKRLELLHETVPTSSTIAALLNEANRPITEVQSLGHAYPARAPCSTSSIIDNTADLDIACGRGTRIASYCRPRLPMPQTDGRAETVRLTSCVCGGFAAARFSSQNPAPSPFFQTLQQFS